ncbi:glycosyltransferase family 2 protein [Candidatus Berkelbacteria bacterium]|nr:glycosyltransferase family 2 protein [Candidatus Berkelbacteria bacterium]
MTLSLAICTLNRPEILIQTIKDVWALPTQPDELIIIDQTENLPDHLAEFYKKFSSKLKVVRMKAKGLGQARNRAIKEASSDLILFIDDDVRLKADLIKYHKLHFTEQDVGAVVGRVDDALGDPPSCGGRVNWFGKVTVDRDVSQVHPVESLSGGNMAMRLDLLRSLGGFWSLAGNLVQLREETDMAMRIKKAGYKVICEPRASLLHLAHKSGGTRSAPDRIDWYHDLFFSEFKYFFRNFPKWKLPFYVLGLARPILACAIYYGKFSPRAISAPWRAMRKAWQ